jgi:hypothetical protein
MEQGDNRAADERETAGDSEAGQHASDKRGQHADETEKSFGRRALHLVVSIVILTGVSVVVGYGGGLLLWASAKLGGPDPRTKDGDLLRDRLLDWPDKNREFMRNNGRGELPLRP